MFDENISTEQLTYNDNTTRYRLIEETVHHFRLPNAPHEKLPDSDTAL